MGRKRLDNGRLLHTYSEVMDDFGYFLDIGGAMEIGLGWMNCVYDCCAKIDALDPQNFTITIITEHDGLLHIGYSYTYTGTEEDIDFITKVDKAIKEAEEESSITCESCGNAGILRDKDWKRVTCIDCEQYLYDIDATDDNK